jgi:hypothetical protein
MIVTLTGGCHCGAVRFAVETAPAVDVEDCNCSICAKTGFLHLIVPKARFRLVQGQDALTRYTFNTGVAQHFFCRVCGVKPFYIPRSNPDGVDVNLRCVDDVTALTITITPFDGQNWEANAASLTHKSKDASIART